jgi:plastocyanin
MEGGWKMKKIVHVASIGIALLIFLMALSPALASSSGPTVKILGDNSARINQRVTSTYHFSPGKLSVRPGRTVTFTNTGQCSVPADCTHTISIVNESQLPVDVNQVFLCLFDAPGTVCGPITGTHFPQGPAGPVVPVANVTGEPSGFQGGNSFVIAHGQTLEIVINAAPGTTLHYMCAIHPWMQGSITVGSNQSDD